MFISSKFFKKFRNLKTDASPKPPRDDPNDDNNNMESEPVSEEHYEYTVEDEDGGKQKPTGKDKKKKSKKNKGDNNSPPTSPVNTQATGNVINIVNSNNVHWGPEYTYHLSTSPTEQDYDGYGTDEEPVKMTKSISKVLEAVVKPEHIYLDEIAKNLGRGWKGFFRRLGLLQGRIETVLEETKELDGVSEVRYKLLLEWVGTNDNNSLGALATALWAHGECALVKQLAVIYKRRSE